MALGQNIQRIGKRVSIVSVLQDNKLLTAMRRNGDRISGCCPVHGGDNPGAFVVTLSQNLWYCFTGCQTGGDSVDLVRLLLGMSYGSAVRYLNDLEETSANISVASQVRSNWNFQAFTRTLRLNPDIPFLKRKGIPSDIATLLEAGLYRSKGFLSNCVGVRLHDPAGRPLGYAGRRLDEGEIIKYGKWKFPRRFPKSRMLFNYHRVHSQLACGLVVVECPWGVMRLHRLNIPAVALLGTCASSEQIQLLAKASRLICMLDGDPAGTTACEKLRFQVNNKLPFHTIALPNGHDPDDLSDLELRRLLSPFFSLTA